MTANYGEARRLMSQAHTGEHWRDVAAERLVGEVLGVLPGMFYRRRTTGRWAVEAASPEGRALTGFSPQDLCRSNRIGYLDLVHVDDRSHVEAAVRRAADTVGPFRVHYRIKGLDGEERQVLDSGRVVIGPDGEPRAEGLVIEVPNTVEDSRFRALVEQSLSGVYLIQQGRFTYVNNRFAEIFGYSVAEILTLPSVLELVHPPDRDVVAGNLQRRIEGSSEELHYQFRGLTKTGSTVDVEVHGRRVDLDGVPHVLGTLLDVSVRVNAERIQREAEKFEALRRLSAGVAHDFNNFLSTIRTTADVLRLERGDDAQLVQDLDAIIAAVDDGVHLSRQLTRFGRRGESGATALPSSVIEGLGQSIRHILGRRFDVRTLVEPDLPAVAMSPGDLEELVTCLVLNAQDAMPDGGALSIAARLAPPSGSDGASAVVVEVSDSGPGISPVECGRAFEPHFTTKGERGTGLGLAVVSKVVRDAGGRIQIDAVPGEGTTVRIALPPAAHG